jgi:hypothetical protein
VIQKKRLSFSPRCCHNLYTRVFDGAARLVISGLREKDERDPQFKLLGLSGSAWEAYKRSRQLEGSDGFDPLGDFVYAKCQDLVNSIPDFVLHEWWRLTSEFPYRLGSPPDVAEMREAVSDEVWYSVNDWPNRSRRARTGRSSLPTAGAA